MNADWTQLILGPELHRGRLGHLLRATRSKGPGPADVVLRLADAWLEPALRSLVTRESALAVRVASPFVVAHEPVAQDAERPYSVMARVDGLSLHALLLGTPAHEAARLLLPAALDAIAGLIALHAASDDEGPLHAVHQAPVPRHIMVGVDGVARLVDFTQAVSRAHPYDPALQALLRAEELTPEQLSRPEHVDARTDVFIAADTFFRVLTGTPAQARSAFRRSHPPDADSAASALAQLPVPPELERVLAWALAADPAARPGSAQALLDALHDALAHTDPLATREELGAHVRKLRGEHTSAAARARDAEGGPPARLGSPSERPARRARSSPPVGGDRAVSTRPFASTYALRTGAEPRETPSTRPPAAVPPSARSGGPRASSAPPRRDYWFALYRDEHTPDDAAPQGAAPTAREGTKPGLASAPPGPLGPDDTWARQRAELGPVLYTAPPWSSPPPALSAPYTEAQGIPARTKTALLTALTVLAVAVTTMVLVSWFDSPTSSASQAPGPAPAPAVAPAAPAHATPRAAEPSPRSDGPEVSRSATGLPSRQGPVRRAPVEGPRAVAPKAAATAARRAIATPGAKAPVDQAPHERAPNEQAAPGPATPTLTLEDFLPSAPASP